MLALIHGWQLTLILLVSAPLLAGSAMLLMTVMADVEAKSAKMYVGTGAFIRDGHVLGTPGMLCAARCAVLRCDGL